jgi:hypothetical protein
MIFTVNQEIEIDDDLVEDTYFCAGRSNFNNNNEITIEQAMLLLLLKRHNLSETVDFVCVDKQKILTGLMVCATLLDPANKLYEYNRNTYYKWFTNTLL